MTEARRKIIAFISIKLISGSRKNTIYDYQISKYSSIGGKLDFDKVHVFDYDRSCYISGRFNGRKFSLYDYGDGSYIDLEVNLNGKIKGYDYGSGSYYSGKVNSNSISFYDYETSLYYNYSV
jgi:hypothetical protein